MTYEFTAHVTDSPFHTHQLVPPLPGAEVLVGYYPAGPGRTYRLEQDEAGARVFLVEDGAARTGDAGPVTVADIAKKQAEFWSARTASK